ncbi:MAG: hypothetical protein WC143_06615 [Eubacteriales bacterium]
MTAIPTVAITISASSKSHLKAATDNETNAVSTKTVTQVSIMSVTCLGFRSGLHLNISNPLSMYLKK